MKKTNSLNSKVKQYVALAGGVAAATGATGQVVYTDINPDEVLTPSGTSQYDLNLDGDAVPDMAFVVVTGSKTGIYTYGTMQIPYTLNYNVGVAAFGTAAPSANGWMGTGSAPSAVPMSNMIGSSGNFVQNQGNIGAYQTTYLGAPINGQYGPYTSGNFLGTEGYVGVRFDISGQTHYGWARVQMAPDGSSMTIKDYAYDATPGTAIAAGDIGSTNIDELGMDNLIHFINKQNNVVVIKNNGISNGTINVVSVDGKVISNEKINNQTEVIDLNGLASGIYVINVTANEGSLSKKVYVR